MKKVKKRVDGRAWHRQWPEYGIAIALARRLIRDKLVDTDWQPDNLSSWLVKPLRASMRNKVTPKPTRRPA